MTPLPQTHQTPLPRSYASGIDDLATALMRSGVVAFALVDSGNVVACSPALRDLLGGTAPYHHVDGQSLVSLAVAADQAGLDQFCRGLQQENARAEHRCRLLHINGSAVPALLQGASVPVEGSCQIVIVVTDLRAWVGEVPTTGASQIFEAFDPATGFATQNLLLDRMRVALAAARRYRRRAAVLRIDLESLDHVLSGLAPGVAQDLQASIAETLHSCVRDCDTFARLTAREFVALLPEVGERSDAGITAARLVEAIARRFEHYPAPRRLTATIGVAVYPSDATSAERLLGVAEAAMHSARSSSAGRFAFADTTGVELHGIEPLAFLPEHRQGLPEIDEEHEALIEQTNRLIKRLHAGASPAALERALRDFIRQLRAHFATEAQRQDAAPSEGARDQQKSNQRFLDELHCILLDVNAQSVTLAIRHLRDWLIPHLLQAEETRLALAS
jgi:diguanylate cyclase (GGDEF)-like protein